MTLSARLPFCAMVACLLVPCLSYAGPHPTRVDEHSNCLECHSDHATGHYVHPAIRRGCTSCHSIENREDASYVALKPTKSVVCFECHQPETVLYVHFPYASGMCMRCHNPHVSASPRLLRAQVNELCLKCHLRSRESVPSRYMPTIALTADTRMGHPFMHHPVRGTPDPLTGGEMCCTSCHLAHGGAKLHHLKMGSEIPEDALNQKTETKDICQNCHMHLWGLDGASGKKKNKKDNKKRETG